MSGPPYSYNTTVASGSTNAVNVTFPYIEKADVHVTINAAPVDDATLTWASDSVIHLASNPIAGDVVKVYRDTPKDVLSVDWSSPSVLAEADIEKAFTQLLYIAQEAYDIGILPQQELDAAINYINTAVNNAQAALDATNAAKASAETEMEGYVTAAAASATSAQNSADAAAAIAEFDPDDYFQKANLFSEVTGDTDKATARSNIGAASAADVVSSAVRYDAAQSLDDTQKGTARSNIGAFPSIGGTISGNLAVNGTLSVTGQVSLTAGHLYVYGYSGHNDSGGIRFNSGGTAHLFFGPNGSGGDYFAFNKHVYSLAGRLWGSNDFSASSFGATSMRWISGGLRNISSVTSDSSPYLVSNVSDDGFGSKQCTLRYLQYYVGGTWYTAGFA